MYNRIINWKIIKNRNLTKIVNMVCYETQEKKQAGLLRDYINKNMWLKIKESDYQEIKKEEGDGHLLLKNERGFYQAVIDKQKPFIDGINFDFSPWGGKEIIFWVDLAERYGLSAHKTRIFKEGVEEDRVKIQEMDRVRVIGLTPRQEEANFRKVDLKRIQHEWEKERGRMMKLPEFCNESENEEEQIEQVEVPPKN